MTRSFDSCNCVLITHPFLFRVCGVRQLMLLVFVEPQQRFKQVVVAVINEPSLGRVLDPWRSTPGGVLSSAATGVRYRSMSDCVMRSPARGYRAARVWYGVNSDRRSSPPAMSAAAELSRLRKCTPSSTRSYQGTPSSGKCSRT